MRLALLAVALLVVQAALGVGIGVNRGNINYVNVLQNGYAEETVLVTTDSEIPIYGSYEIEGEIAPWVRIEPSNESFTFSTGNPHQLRIIIEPPADAQLQGYTGAVRVLTGEVARSEGGRIGTSTRAAFLIKIALGLTGTQIYECAMGGVGIGSTEIGQPFDFTGSIINRGNVRIQPSYEIVVYDQYQTEILANLSVTPEQEILPTTTFTSLSQVRHDLWPGQYWALVNVPTCSGSKLLTFDVLERGGIADQGELLSLSAKSWAETGEIIPITAVFQNQGSRIVEARLKGTITRQDSERLFKVIDTDPINVRPGEKAELETFFNPLESGRYIVAGRVLYNNKLTYQRSTIINVQGPTLEAIANYSGFIAMAVIIILLLLLIARKRRRKRR